MTAPRDARPQSAARLTRRQLLQAGGIGALAMGLPGTVAASVEAGRGLAGGAAERSCIFVLLCGGPSHIDTWDLKPDAPDEIRGPYQARSPRRSPACASANCTPALSALTQHFTLIRSMTHVGNISNHFDAMHHLLSGQAGAPADSPYLGSILSRVRPSEQQHRQLRLADPLRRRSGLLCPEHRHRRPPRRPAHARCSSARPTITRPCRPSASPTNCSRRSNRTACKTAAACLTAMATQLRRVGRAATPRLGRAARPGLRSGQRLRRPARCSRCTASRQAVRDRYGMHPLGQNLLLARRLVEAGVGFVTVNGWTGPAPGQAGGGPPASSWDMHGSEMGMGNAFGNGSYGMGWCLPCLDQGLSALLTDLHDRGLLERTLVVVMGEFGRTPRINQPHGNPGPAALAVVLVGHPCRRRHSRRRRLRRNRQDRRLRQGPPRDRPGPRGHHLPLPWNSLATSVSARTASPAPSPPANHCSSFSRLLVRQIS